MWMAEEKPSVPKGGLLEEEFESRFYKICVAMSKVILSKVGHLAHVH